MNNTFNPVIKKKKTIEHPHLKQANSQKVYRGLVGSPDVEQVFPIQIDPTDLTLQLKQEIFETQKQYLNNQAILINNRTKYQQLFAGLATILDQRGISSEEVVKFLSGCVFYPN